VTPALNQEKSTPCHHTSLGPHRSRSKVIKSGLREAGALARQRMRARVGHCEGRKPYGFRPGEPEVIEQIRALRSAGLGLDRIAGRLNDEGVKPRTGVKWYPTSVSRVLQRASWG
jgi:hypothetical protein